MSTRSRRASPLPVSPIKQALMANVMAAGKGTGKNSTRKVLADKTNATPVAGLVPVKSGKKASAASKKGESTPCGKMRPLEQAETPVMRGEDLLRSLVHSNLAMIQTPSNGVSSQSPQADTPQFRVSTVSAHVGIQEAEAAAELSTASEQAEVIDSSPQNGVASVSERLSSAWVGQDVDDVTEEAGDDASDSDCSVVVNVSSPGVSQHLAASPAPSTVHPTTPETADFKWQRREFVKVKEAEESFDYYEGDDCEEREEYDDEEYEQVDCDDICYGVSRIKVAEGLPEHKGRHIRFNYNSDDEVDIEEVDVLRLRGLPTPRGKHLRFPEDEDVPSPQGGL